MKDYEMKATSRAANPWIMVLSGLLAVGLIGVLFSRRK
jgi:LPXTG-motif cell wall-anchored protein